MFQSLNPYTLKVNKNYSFTSETRLNSVLRESKESYFLWKKETIVSRSGQVKQLGRSLESRLEEASKLITQEMGKPISQSRNEIRKCVDLCDFYSAKAETYLKDKKVETSFESYITYEPLGTILGIMPWNYPFWQVFRFAIPTLLAGNSIILKHALNVPECALFMESIFQEVLSVSGVFQNMFLSNEVTQKLISDPIIKGVSLTGSTRAGRIVGSEAGKNLKPVVLELGGSNAMIIFKDADINKAVDSCIKGRFQNNGQSCIAVKRLLIDKAIEDVFIEKLLVEIQKLKIGNPEDEDTFFSVLSKVTFATDLQKALMDTEKNGGQIIFGGNVKEAVFEPTIVKGVTKEMSIFKQETFGPILPITTFSTNEEAITLANDTDFGLGVSVFSEDKEFVESLINQFDDGAVFVNTFVQSIADLPFGGTKTSGLGRELSEEGIKAFTNTKTVVIK